MTDDIDEQSIWAAIKEAGVPCDQLLVSPYRDNPRAETDETIPPTIPSDSTVIGSPLRHGLADYLRPKVAPGRDQGPRSRRARRKTR